MRKCFKCGKTEEETTIIRHHIKYIPECVVDCCLSCHKTIHNKVRRNNSCPYSVQEVGKLSRRSSNKRFQSLFRKVRFQESIAPDVEIVEELYYNEERNKIWFSSSFHSTHGKELFYITE